KRKPFIIWALLIGTISRVPLAFTHSYTIALILLAIGGFNAFSFFFALLNDFIVKKQESKSQAGTITGTVRMAFSLSIAHEVTYTYSTQSIHHIYLRPV
ncbi:hypothetical protein ABWL24_19440, partial [Priestia megaterium]